MNCNEDITLPMMTQYMMGMVQSGSGVLFDDTDRLTKGNGNAIAQNDRVYNGNCLYCLKIQTD